MSLRKKATTGLVWTFAQQFGGQVIGFVVSLVLARILLPEEFGLIGMISIFIAIGNSFLNSGLTQSIIRTSEADLDQEDYSTVFFFNLLASLLLYATSYAIAPLVADFYDQAVLVEIIRLYCLSFVITAFSAVQLARLTKKMDFKTQTLVAIPSIVLSGIVGVYLAYNGHGVWSLVYSYLLKEVLNATQLWFHSKWQPSLMFSVPKFRYHFFFGYKLTLSGLLDVTFKNLYIILIGRYFSANQVGFYTRAETMKQLPVTNISNALNKVTYPLFASIKNDDVRLRRVYKQIMQMVVFAIAPVLIFLAVLAEPVFRFLFTEKWLPAVPFFQIICVTGILYPVHSYNLNILKVKGRSDLFLRLEVIKKMMVVAIIAGTLPFGILALLGGQVLNSLIAFFINTHYTGKLINFTAWQQSRSIGPIILLAAVVGAGVFALDHFLELSGQLDIVRILAGGLLGAGLYLGAAYLFKVSSLFELKRLLARK